MNKLILAAFLVSCPLMSFAGTHSCSDQTSELMTKIEAAKNAGNSAEVSRLNIALDKIKTYCTDERQANRANKEVSKHENKVNKAERELQEAQQELDEAMANDRSDRIAQKTRKVEEKKARLASAKSELKQSQDEAARL